jgi:hypothetical protein
MSVEEPAMDLIITAPDDWHHHLRDGDALRHTVYHAAREFQRVVRTCIAVGVQTRYKCHLQIVMPNLKPPVRTTEEALGYREVRVLQSWEIAEHSRRAAYTGCNTPRKHPPASNDSIYDGSNKVCGLLCAQRRLDEVVAPRR